MVYTDAELQSDLAILNNNPQTGLAVRGAIARISNKVIDDSSNVFERQNSLENDFLAVQADSSTTSPSGAEVVVARDGYATLDERLTKKEQEVAAQLAQTENDIESVNIELDSTVFNLYQLESAKLNKDGIISIGQLDKSKGLIDATYLSKAVLQSIAGTAPINAIPSDGSLTNSKYANNSITPDKLMYSIPGKNYVRGEIEKGTLLDGNPVASDNFIRSAQFIPIKPGRTYTISDDRNYWYRVFGYDATGSMKLSTTSITFTVPSDVVTIKFSTYSLVTHNNVVTKVMINEGTEALPYSNPWNLIPKALIEEGVSKYSKTEGVTFGDSITWYDKKLFGSGHLESGQTVKGYQTYMEERMGCIIENKGESGKAMPNIVGYVRAYTKFASRKFATLTSGANDQRLGVPVGTLKPVGSNFDLTTYIGCLQSSIEYMLSQNPSLQIYLITPIKGWYNSYNTPDVPNTNPNVIGVMSPAYPDAMLSVGKFYSIPVHDWYYNVGLNELNKSVLLGDTETVAASYRLHPRNALYKRMADSLIPFMENN